MVLAALLVLFILGIGYFAAQAPPQNQTASGTSSVRPEVPIPTTELEVSSVLSHPITGEGTPPDYPINLSPVSSTARAAQ